VVEHSVRVLRTEVVTSLPRLEPDEEIGASMVSVFGQVVVLTQVPGWPRR